MKKYEVTVYSNFNTETFDSDSRNSKQHLRNCGGYRCIVKNRSGDVVSAAAYSDEFGFYNICCDE